MNNLLRTLTEGRAKSLYPETDLKLLLTTVKESRRQSYDAKVSTSDAFYDSLEGLLSDLKTVTIDNHDAEPFLKPVSKAEAPDYYDVIANPMDFATMLKKVKSKQYKSKREFKDDLELIWSNCLTYNAAENHPLRPCVKRLKLKADRLLKYITDRKERADPPIPSDISTTHVARPKINGNGALNGRAYSHQRSPSITTVSKSITPNIKLSPTLEAKPVARRDAAFPDTPAIVRTPQGMALFSRLDREITQHAEAPSGSKLEDSSSLLEKLHELVDPVELPAGSESYQTPPPEDGMAVDKVSPGEKRKLNGFVDDRPRKRARFSSQYAMPVPFEKDELSELWWGAVQSDPLLASGLPQIPLPSSSASPTALARTRKPKVRSKRRKKPTESAPKSLLTMMNNNIKTMRRLRQTHAKFAALNVNATNAEDPEGGGEGAPFAARGGTPITAVGEEDGIETADEKVDERPWMAMVKGKRRVGGVEIGDQNAADCVKWMSGKVLEHVGFQGTSQAALEVLAGVTSEYLLNVGRTIRFLCDKYCNTMTPEEIILHTLFESGTSKIQDLERYISDDVERYGTRLLDVEKKLVSAYRESTAVEMLDDEGLFRFDEEDEEAGALAIGDFADALGEDYLGLRELGIAAEFGLSSLAIPKKLLRGKKSKDKSSAAAKPTEPPPPYPPPPPFIPLNASKVDDQIGLLKPYYQSRFSALAAMPQQPASISPPPLPGPSMPQGQPSVSPSQAQPPQPAYGMPPYPPVSQEVKPPVPPPAPVPPESLILPDDPPNPLQVKMGALGQIIKGNPAAATTKKKKPGPPGAGAEAPTPTKKKGMVGVGTGNGRKKSAKVEEATAATATPSQPQLPAQSQPRAAPPTILPYPAHMPPMAPTPDPLTMSYGYGAPPAGGYGAPPPPHRAPGGGYGAPPGGYGPPGYGGGFAPPGGHHGPPPGADPQLWSWFSAVDTDRSGAITAPELERALINGDWTPFDLDTVKMLMSIFDTDRSGTIGFNEFSGLWKYIKDWQNVFRHFDRDRSGSIDGHELRDALAQFGYNLSPQLLDLLQRKYDVKASTVRGHGAPPPGISFDRFVRACVVVKQLSEAFGKLDTDRDGWIQINYDQFMHTVLSLP
ncbi:putative bromo domain containing protein [Lyophyllum shimeji]|uniref:Bromo domain containing protein n=1 Tax=Lyophyllum shimeji TaxID=47721 RepID=A0A9P3PKE4_LYOSH|nr:putative bromo domain containing protein [Lyophyllum shimeji]